MESIMDLGEEFYLGELGESKADRLLAEGHVACALQVYEDILDITVDIDTRERILEKIKKTKAKLGAKRLTVDSSCSCCALGQ